MPPGHRLEAGALGGMANGRLALPAAEPRGGAPGEPTPGVDEAGPPRVVEDRHDTGGGGAPRPQLRQELPGRVLDLVIGIGEGEEAGLSQLSAPRRVAVRARDEQPALGLEHAADLTEHRHARMDVLDHVEEEHCVEVVVGERERRRDVPGEEAHVADAAGGGRGRRPPPPPRRPRPPPPRPRPARPPPRRRPPAAPPPPPPPPP